MKIKETFTNLRSGVPIALCFVAMTFGAGKPAVMAAPLEEARVSRVIQDVRLLGSNAAPRPAAVNDDIKQGTAVRTGAESRAELTFTDQTITRLGQNTVFSIKGGSREVSLDSGAILLQVPHGGEPAQIRTAAVTASISGGTAMFSSNPNFPKKLLVLEGLGHFCRERPPGERQRPEDCVEVPAGQMVMMLPDGSITKPTKFNAKLVFTTAHLLADFPPLANEYLILQVIDEQEGGAGAGATPTPPPDDIDETDQRDAASPTPSPTSTASSTPTPTPSSTPTPTPSSTPTPTPSSTPTPTPSATPTPTPSATPTPTSTPSATPTPTGTPSKYGTPTTISSPDPYVIDSDTVISTDPAITNNGQTDYGKIYRGRDIDGAFSLWAFGSTSAFDTSSGFDDQIDSSGAVFKFSNLILQGDPVINTEGGEVNLGLVAVNSIVIGPSGGLQGNLVLTFSGLDGLLFATVNGPITVSSNVDFTGLRDLTFYARGATSDLTLDGNFDAMHKLNLYAERDILGTGSFAAEKINAVARRDISLDTGYDIEGITMSFRAGNNITIDGFDSSRTVTDSSGDISFVAGNDISVPGGLYIDRYNGGNIDSGLNFTMDAGHDISAENIDFYTHTGNVDGGNLLVTAGHDVMAPNGISLQTTAASGGGGKNHTGPHSLGINGANVTLHADNDIVTSDIYGAANLNDSFFNEGGDMSVSAGRDIHTTSGGISLQMQLYGGGSIGTGGNISVEAGGNLLVESGFSGIDLHILNESGHITDGGNISVTTGGDLTAPSISAIIDNIYGGSIDLGGNIDVTIGGAFTITGGDANFRINRGDSFGPEQVNGGGGETINVQADSIDITAGSLNANILNNGNPFASQGNVTVHSDNNITVAGSIDCWGIVSAGTKNNVGNITVGGNVSVPTDLNATGFISVTQGIFAFSVSAVDDITVGGGPGSVLLFANDLTTDHALNLMNASQVGPVSLSSFGDINFSPDPMTWTVDSIVTTGPSIPFIVANGEDASPDFGNNNPGNGGHITLNITGGGLAIGSEGTINYIEANGGDYNNLSVAGGNAGMVDITATGDVTLNDGDDGRPAITTLTGLIPDDGPAFMGDGGKVNITAGGEITVNSTIQVSSNDQFKSASAPDETPPPASRSASGGDITLTSTKTSDTAINITSSAQLLSILNNAAPGEGGKIVLVASNPGKNSKNSSSIDIDNSEGGIFADRGTVEIRHQGAFGSIDISNAYIFADIVKVGALGPSGTLTIGGGLISADSQLKLYAGGSNGTIHFIANVTLSSPVNILAADTVHIDMGVTVFIDNLNKTPADVYTNHAEYGIAGTGNFGGAGADTHSFIDAPPFGSAPTASNRRSSRNRERDSRPVYREVIAPLMRDGVLTTTRIRALIPDPSGPDRSRPDRPAPNHQLPLAP